jgi:hypothetical protein
LPDTALASVFDQPGSLVLSFAAAYAGPIIVMSQNRHPLDDIARRLGQDSP